MCREGIIPANPAADLDLPRKQSRSLPKSLSGEEIERLMRSPDLNSPFGGRDRNILERIYATGNRRTEMANLAMAQPRQSMPMKQPKCYDVRTDPNGTLTRMALCVFSGRWWL